MTIIIASDIFGMTPSLKAFAKRLQLTQHNVYIVDPYSGVQHDFMLEEQAYQYFISNVGLDSYANTVDLFIEDKTLLTANQNNTINVLIGFSIGASALWQLSANERIKAIDSTFYFYGSQIRKLLHIQPAMPSIVILPKYESHFNVTKLEQALQKYALVSTKRCNYLHGFMNTHSINFNEYAYTYYSQWLCSEITKKSPQIG